MLKYIYQLIIIATAGFFIFSCQDDRITSDSDASLSFTCDTVSFDTVFTTLGSTTDWFKVKNENNEAVVVSRILLAGGEDSPFRLNINGVESIDESDIKIAAGDSMFIFVAVTIDPTGQNNPMVINDSVVFYTNGNVQDVNLIAFGQDFHLFNGEVIESQHWQNDKPYLIYNSVMVDTLETLTIDAGCRIHFHNQSGMFVKGTLDVNGTVDEPVIFQGDRMEDIYSDVPGQWGDWYEYEDGSIYVYGGIHFLQGSRDNTIDYAVIKNAEKGIECDSLGVSENPMLVISNSRVENMTLNCVDARSSNIIASNCIFANSGSYCLKLILGGEYEFYHCTVANYYSYDTRSEPALFLNNFYEYDDVIYSYNLEKAYFGNCIIYGSEEAELGFGNAGGGSFNFHFQNCLIKTGGDSDLQGDGFENSFFDENPLFTDLSEYIYSIDSLSPARDIGNLDVANLYPYDLENNSRLADEGPDLGAIEWVPTPPEE